MTTRERAATPGRLPTPGVARRAVSRFGIGASLPLTGEFAEPGEAARRGYEVWMEMVNEAGGLLGRPFKLVIKDDQSDQNLVVTDYNALIEQDQVDLLLGTFSSLLNIPASAVAERAQMVYVEPAGGSPDMFNRGFEYLFFAQQATAPHQADLFSEWVVEPARGRTADHGCLHRGRRPVRRTRRRGHPVATRSREASRPSTRRSIRPKPSTSTPSRPTWPRSGPT